MEDLAQLGAALRQESAAVDARAEPANGRLGCQAQRPNRVYRADPDLWSPDFRRRL